MNSTCAVKVDKYLHDLIPNFMANRHREVDELRAALERKDYERLRQIGHRMKGLGRSFGFDYVSVIGIEIERAARAADKALLGTHIADYRAYVNAVRITYC